MHEMSPKKSLGQHWLNDGAILDQIIGTANLKAGDHVLEIGPGPGGLTRRLLNRGVVLTAIEKDEWLAAQLKAEIKNENFCLQTGDILEFDLTKLPAEYKVVANIPYYLTSNLVRLLSESANPPASITLLVQKEVAERLCALPGQMSLLSVGAQAYYQAGLGIIVPAARFKPPPKVDSQVVHLVRRPSPAFDKVQPRQFFRVVKAGFSARRKTLLNSLSGGLDLPKEKTRELLDECAINAGARPQELSLEQWNNLANKINT